MIPAKPWYREPWPWLLMAGPAAVVVASIVSAILAIATADPLVSEYNVKTEGAAKKAEVPWRSD
jgi:hypothetical protein